jgi:hypothetical protein
MLFVIACACLMMPALTCSANMRAGTIEQPAESWWQHHMSGEREPMTEPLQEIMDQMGSLQKLMMEMSSSNCIVLYCIFILPLGLHEQLFYIHF